MCLRLRLFQKFFSEVLQCRRRSHIVALLIEAVHILCTAVDDGLLAFGKTVSRDDLLAKALQELGFLDDRIALAVVFAHVHGIDVVRRSRGYLDDRSAQSTNQRCIFALRVDDDNIRIRREHQTDDLVLSGKRFA